MRVVFSLFYKRRRGEIGRPACRQAGAHEPPTAGKLKIMYYVYAIKSINKNYIYVGLTNNPDRRIKQHNSRKEKTTRAYAPFKIIKLENYQTRAEARAREKYLKSGIGKEYLKSLL